VKVELSAETSAAITRLAQEAAAEPVDSNKQTAARATNALPIYADWSAILLITPDGDVIWHCHEDGKVEPADKDGWHIFCRTVAARRYPELFELMPK
jgi:hypothetical protein